MPYKGINYRFRPKSYWEDQPFGENIDDADEDIEEELPEEDTKDESKLIKKEAPSPTNKPNRNSPEAIKERLSAGLYLQMILEEEERERKSQEQKKER
jgi:hypothetical protein